MTLQQIYDLAIEMGMKSDPRTYPIVAKVLEKRKKDYELLSAKKKKYFDMESLRNPYADSSILFGDPKTSVKKVMAGIDSAETEVLLADRLNQKGEKIDLLISHHPGGHALASLYDVMDVQIDMYASAGVPVNVADALFQERKSLVKRRFSPLNHARSVDTARLLQMPLLALHTIWDNIGNQFMKDYLKKKTFKTAGKELEYINDVPEFTKAKKAKSGQTLFSGGENARAGKVV